MNGKLQPGPLRPAPLQRPNRMVGQHAIEMTGVADEAEAPAVLVEAPLDPWTPDAAAVGSGRFTCSIQILGDKVPSEPQSH